MRATRRKNTNPELQIRSELHRAGLRYRVDLRIRCHEGFVRPDIVFTKSRVAIFVDGCFWHGCPDHYVAPRSNGAFWAGKLAANRERDARDSRRLKSEGWTVIRVWEHEAPSNVLDSVRVALGAGSH